MKLYYSNQTMRIALNGRGNFGDDLNPWLWGRVLPDQFDDDDTSFFIGIGTLLREGLPEKSRLTIFGAGCGYGQLPAVGSNWNVYCVRGPLTAAALGLSESHAVVDPAILVRKVFDYQSVPKQYRISYIPHAFEIQANERTIRGACEDLGYHCIDPRTPVGVVMRDIAASELIICEAMHGAIVADAFRVPWTALRTNAGIPTFKWTDWCESVGWCGI